MSTVVRIPFQRHRYGAELLVDARFANPGQCSWYKAPHELDFYEVLFVTEGRGRVRRDSIEASVEPGTAILTPPGCVRILDLEPDSCRFILCFQQEFLYQHGYLHPASRDLYLGRRFRCLHPSSLSPVVRLAPQDRRHLLRVLASMELEIGRLDKESHDLLWVRLHEVLLELQRAYRKRFVEEGRPTVWADRFLSLVERRFRQTHRVADYADRMAVTPGHLRRLARVHLGAGPKAVLRARILLEARRLLLDGERTVSEIGHELGFDDPSYFCRFFRHWEGVSPLEFRQKSARAGPDGR